MLLKTILALDPMDLFENNNCGRLQHFKLLENNYYSSLKFSSFTWHGIKHKLEK